MRLAIAVWLSILVSAPAFADDALPAQRITITVPGRLPDAEAVVKALERPGTRHEVRVQVRKQHDGERMQLDVWGNSVAASDVDPLLRARFPALASASIDVAPLSDPPPAIEGETGPGRRVIVKKRIVHTQP